MALKVRDVMTGIPVVLQPEQTVADAAVAMRGVRRLPVVEGSRAVGIVSLGDLAL